MITIIEIPHQKPTMAWTASTFIEACEVCAQTQPDREVAGLDKAALYEWLDDNQMTVVLETADDWREFFTVAAPVHQRHKAHKEARELIRHMGRGCLNGKGRA